MKHATQTDLNPTRYLPSYMQPDYLEPYSTKMEERLIPVGNDEQSTINNREIPDISLSNSNHMGLTTIITTIPKNKKS